MYGNIKLPLQLFGSEINNFRYLIYLIKRDHMLDFGFWILCPLPIIFDFYES